MICSSNETLELLISVIVLASTLLKVNETRREMISYETKEEKWLAAKNSENKKKVSMYETFKSKIEGLEDAVLESGSVKHAGQFTKMLEEIAMFRWNTTVRWLQWFKM